MNTIVGPIKYGKNNVSETPLVGGQWVKGKKWPWNWKLPATESILKSRRRQLCFPDA